MAADQAAPAVRQFSEAELDGLAIAICLTAFEAFGAITPEALDLAAEAVLTTDQIAGSAEDMLTVPPGG